jgi:hypothetical protein
MKLLSALLLLALFLVSGAAYADVALTCQTNVTGSIGSCAWPTGFKAVEYGAITPDTQLVRCPNPTEADMHPANCFGTWAKLSEIAATDMVLVCRGATLTTPLVECTPVNAGQGAMTAVRRKSTISALVTPPVVPPPVTPPPPPWTKPTPLRCTPALIDTRIVTALPNALLFTQCEDAQGYQHRGYAGDPTDLLRVASAAAAAGIDATIGLEGLAKTTKAQQDALHNASIDGPFSTEQAALYVQAQTKYAWRFVVSGSTTTPVYLRNEDGTRGARYKADGVNQSIAAGKPCNGVRRLTGTTTRYHIVGGNFSATGVTLPAGTYAQCTLKRPPTTGW